MKPVPPNVADGDWPDFDTPLYQLTARCLGGWHKTAVGSKFRYEDESIRLNADVDVSFDQWQDMARHNRLSQGFPKRLRLHCGVCGKRTWMTPLGAARL